MKEDQVRICLIEKDDVDIYLIKSLLEEENDLIIEAFSNIHVGIDAVKQKSYDLILLGVDKDKKQGITQFKEIYQHINHIPILVLSMIQDNNFALEIVKYGAQDYLTKQQLTRHGLVKAIYYAIERFNYANQIKEIEKFKQISEKITDGIIITSKNNEVVFSNDSAKVFFSFVEDLLINKETVVTVKNRIYEVNYSIINWDEHQDAKLIYFKDITEKKEFELAGQINEAKYRSLFENLTDGFVYGKVIYNDQQITDLLFLETNNKFKSYLSEQVLENKTLTHLFPRFIKQPPEWLEHFKEMIEFGKEVRFNHYSRRNSRWYAILTYKIKNDYFAAIVRDITTQKQSEQELEYFSTHDAMTNLYNRSFYEKERKRLAKQVPLTLLLCDIDGLKMVNDTLGHDAGDQVIQKTAQIMKDSFRKDDIICRMGGDEFLLILPFVNEENVKKMIARFDHNISEYNRKKEYYISVSIGHASRLDAKKSFDQLYKEADQHMYSIKEKRKDSARNSIIKTLNYALIQRDFKSEENVDQVKQIVNEFAKAINYQENILDLQLLAQFHDIGKVGIPDVILFKPGQLTSEEWKVMKSHVDIGFEIAESSYELKKIAKWILYHHEQWNGEGYPEGLKEQNIPLECRLIAIVDAYDAMTSDRPYRKALSHVAALAQINKEKGIKFDPYLVDMFMKIMIHNKKS